MAAAGAGCGIAFRKNPAARGGEGRALGATAPTGEKKKREGRRPPGWRQRAALTLTCLSSAVVSSNSSPSLKLISVFLKVLWVFTVTLSPATSMMVVGLVSPAICLVAKPTPGGGK